MRLKRLFRTGNGRFAKRRHTARDLLELMTEHYFVPILMSLDFPKSRSGSQLGNVKLETCISLVDVLLRNGCAPY